MPVTDRMGIFNTASFRVKMPIQTAKVAASTPKSFRSRLALFSVLTRTHFCINLSRNTETMKRAAQESASGAAISHRPESREKSLPVSSLASSKAIQR